MPLAMVWRSEKVEGDLLGKIMRSLPAILAKHLDVPELPPARLAPDDVEARQFGSPYDVGHHDIEVVVIANKFEARIATGQLRVDDIALELEEMLRPGMTGFVWVLLVDGFFRSFKK